MQIITIPKKRVKYLKDNLKIIENELLVSIKFKEDFIEIEGDEFKEYIAEKVIDAISRGFDVNASLKLTDEDNIVKTINLKDFLSDRLVKRQLGRIIGEKGKSKKIIEEEGKVNISIQEHEVSILGNFEDVEVAVNAIQKLINGTPHTNVFRYISEAQAKMSGKI
ncbi:MAG: KH domain-containing protein [Candidatus Micrarchaeia archaeon]|jgi:ribosomal RNA assembly protein